MQQHYFVLLEDFYGSFCDVVLISGSFLCISRTYQEYFTVLKNIKLILDILQNHLKFQFCSHISKWYCTSMEAFFLRPWFVLFSQSMFYKQLCVYTETFALLLCSRCKECIVLPGMKGPLIVHRRVSQQVNPNDEWKLNVYIDNFDEYGICFTTRVRKKGLWNLSTHKFLWHFYFIFKLHLM